MAVVSRYIRPEVENQSPSEKAVYDLVSPLYYPDIIINQTGSFVIGQDVTYNAGWRWRISKIEYTNTVANTINFPLASPNHIRLDSVILANTNSFLRVPGTESLSNALPPDLPNNVIFVGNVFVTDTAITPPDLPVLMVIL